MNASGRPNTCKSDGIEELAPHESGARVRNTYVTYLCQGDSPGKLGLIPRNIQKRHRFYIKAVMRLMMGVRLIR